MTPKKVRDDVAAGYAAFVASKMKAAQPSGFDVPDDWLSPHLKPFQREIVRWGVKVGRPGMFLDTGLGKTLGTLSWGSAIVRHTGGPMLYLCPLAVGPQTLREARKFDIPGVHLAERQADVKGPGIYVTNYGKLHLFDAPTFAAAALGEGSILKSFTGVTKRELCESFKDTPYRMIETATPAPNDHMELGNHAAFLGVMDSDEMLTRWFINDQAHAGEYRLKQHAAADYWRWVATWACCVSKPSDIGYSDDGYDLPELRIIEHVAAVDHLTAEEIMARGQKLNATKMHAEMRKTAAVRARVVAGLVAAEPDEPWLIWCHTDYEADALAEAIPHAVEVRGSMPEKRKVERLTGFSEGRHSILISKPSLCGFGMNWQHCARVAFVGVNYSWELFYQAIRRCWRFGQTRPVMAHVVCAETETEVLDDLKRKQRGNDEMKEHMVAAVRESWREQHQPRQLVTSYTPKTAAGQGWELRLGDCCQEIRSLADVSVDFSIFSPPFSTLYIYSDSAFDMGNAADDAEFFRHFKYLIPELLRVTVPGRLCAVHCKDLPLYANRDGASGLQDFPADISGAFRGAGWTFHSRVTIWKCPVTERERTNNHGLLHATVLEDSTRVRQGMADFLLVFRKPPTTGTKSDKPVRRPEGFTEWHGDPEFDPRVSDYHPSKFARKPGKKARTRTLDGGREVDLTPSVNIWQRYADPVWWHVNQRRVLNYEAGRKDKDEKHICPLQLDVIREAVALWTNPGDLVFSPFAGVGSEGHESLLLGRRFLGIELHDGYFDLAAKHLKRAATEANQKDLFTDYVEAAA